MKPSLLILAAGMGSRYGGLKQVDALGPGGEAIIEYSIYDAIQAGFGKVVFVIRKDIEVAFKEKFSNKFDGLIEVAYVFQEFDSPIEGIDEFPNREKPWGTAHAVLMAADAIAEPFAVINADDYYGTAAYKTIAQFLTEKASPTDYAMIGYVLKNTLSDSGTVNRGVCEMDDQNLLTNVVECLKIQRQADGTVTHKKEDGTEGLLQEDNLVSMNFWGFHPNIFPIIRTQFIDFVKNNWDQPRSEFFIPLVVNDLIKTNRVKLHVLSSEDQWYGVTYQEDKSMVVDAFQALTTGGTYPTPLWK